MDLFALEVANQYAEHCATKEREGNPAVLQTLLKTANAPGDPATYKAVCGYRILEEEEAASGPQMQPRYFLDAHGLTFEINEMREELLSATSTHVALGLACHDNVYVITEVFSAKPLRLESIKATEDEKSIEVSGKMLTDQLGPYALRVTVPNDASNHVCLIGPESIKYNPETKEFHALLDKPELLYANPPFICEIYLREKPQTIPYEKPATSDVAKDLQHLKLAYKAPMELYPDPRLVMEETEERAREEEADLERRRVPRMLIPLERRGGQTDEAGRGGESAEDVGTGDRPDARGRKAP